MPPNLLVDSATAHFDRVLHLLGVAMDAPIVALLGFELDRHHFVAGLGIEPQQALHCVSLCGLAMASTNPVCVFDLAADRRFSGLPVVTGEPGLRAFASMPIRSPEGLTQGCLWVADLRPRHYHDSQLVCLAEAAQIIERELQLRVLARYDTLTSLHNPFFAEEELNLAWRRAARERCQIGCLMLDLDHFGHFNDSYGRSTGDAALRVVASALGERFRRATDLVIRIGGDRFLIVVTESDMAQLRLLAERLREDVEALSLGNAAANHLLTATVGYASMSTEDPQASIERLLERTEQSMLDAKRQGRNRVGNPG